MARGGGKGERARKREVKMVPTKDDDCEKAARDGRYDRTVFFGAHQVRWV